MSAALSVRHIPEEPLPNDWLERGLGRLGRHVEHDEQSKSFRVARHVTALHTVLWKRRSPILNQLEIGRCTGNALAGVLGTEPFYRPSLLVDEALADKLYRLATRLDNIPGIYPPDDTGSSGLAVCKAGKKLGLIAGYAHAFSIEDTIAALQRGPVIGGFNWYAGFDKPDANALISIAGAIRGGHEWEINGYDVDTKLFSCLQSWGLRFGHRGVFRMHATTLQQLLREEGDVTVPLPLAAAA